MRLRHFAPFYFCLLGSLNFAFAQALDANWSLPQLMQSMAQVRAASARFSERQTVPMLTTPLLSAGTLSYVAPDVVRKITTSPARQDFVLDHGVVTLTGLDQQTHRFSVSQAPQIAGLVEGIRATLAGDLPALQRVYTVRLTGNAASWQLLMQPKDPDVARFVKWIIIQGSENRINAVDTASSDGGHSEMGITEDQRNVP
jgi:hypothetical protein